MGRWMTGHPKAKREITQDEAVGLARLQRDQLVSGCKLLEMMPESGGDADYAKLQEDLDRLATPVVDACGAGWGHKYLYLIHPKKIDDYHATNFQSFNLIKLLQTPPAADGLYRCAGRFVALARLLDVPMDYLTHTLNHRNGRPYKYWRLGTRPGEAGSRWEEMLANSYGAIGWEELGNLEVVRNLDKTAAKQHVKDLLERNIRKTRACLADRHKRSSTSY
jgi:5-methylcytosine-specific restriction enzyme B